MSRKYNFTFLVFLWFLFVIPPKNITAQHPNKFVIGCEGAGFFSIFFTALNHLAWCERNNKIPVIYWDRQCLYFQEYGYNGSINAWEYYFEPVSHLQYLPSDRITRGFYAVDGSSMPYLPFNTGLFDDWYKSLKPFNGLIQKYIKVKNSVLAKIADFYVRNMTNKKTIGLHLRGTDKHLETQIKPISLDVLIAEANKYDGYQYLVATDEQKYLDYAKKKLKGPVIAYNAFRSTDSSPIHYNPKITRALRGEEVLIESILLSKCDLLIHTCSNVSVCCYYFNPALKGILLTAQKNFYVNM